MFGVDEFHYNRRSHFCCKVGTNGELAEAGACHGGGPWVLIYKEGMQSPPIGPPTPFSSSSFTKKTKTNRRHLTATGITDEIAQPRIPTSFRHLLIGHIESLRVSAFVYGVVPEYEVTKSLFSGQVKRVRAPLWLVNDVMRVLLIRVRTDRKGKCVAAVTSAMWLCKPECMMHAVVCTAFCGCVC